MADSPNKITAEVELEGQRATLAVDLNFYRTFLRLTGRDLLAGMGADRMTPDEMVALVYCALRSGKSEIVAGLSDADGMELVGSIVHPANLGHVSMAIASLMEANSPPKEGGDPLGGGTVQETVEQSTG